MEDITSKQGENHVTSTQFRAILAAVLGSGSYIADQDDQLEPELAANNILNIHSGVLIHHGSVRRVPPGTYDQVAYLNGTQAMKRIDLVVVRYTKSGDIETSEWVVIRGTPAESDPEVPTYTEGNMQNGDLVDDCPVFELHFNGINVTEVKKLLSTRSNTAELESIVAVLNGGTGASGAALRFKDPEDYGYTNLTYGYWGDALFRYSENTNGAPTTAGGILLAVSTKKGDCKWAFTNDNEIYVIQHDTDGNTKGWNQATAPRKNGMYNFTLQKPANKAYGQNYYQYTVPVDNADKYNVAVEEICIEGMGYIGLENINISLVNGLGVTIQDASEIGIGLPINVVLKITPK